MKPIVNPQSDDQSDCSQAERQWRVRRLFNLTLLSPRQDHFCRWCALQWNICDNTRLFFWSDAGKKRQESIQRHKQSTDKHPDLTLALNGDKSVKRIKHFPPFSRRILPFLSDQTQDLQGMPCHGVFLNNCSTFPSFAAHTPPSLLSIARQLIQSPTVTLTWLSFLKQQQKLFYTAENVPLVLNLTQFDLVMIHSITPQMYRYFDKHKI